jgi:hypothetical protein
MSESGKVVVTKSKLDGLANAINDKAKSPGPKTIAQLTQTVNDMKTDGASVFLVTLTTPTYDLGSQEYQITADKSFTEIFAAYQNGDIVRAKWGTWTLDLVDLKADTATFAAGQGSWANSESLTSVTAQCKSNDSWKIGFFRHVTPFPSSADPKAPGSTTSGSSYRYAREDHVHPKELPNVTTADNGKFLRVVNGAWSVVEIANANGGSF